MVPTENAADVVIVGGGLAGLTAAIYLARGGRSVILVEKSHQLGGRARTQAKHDFLFNQGPHALYRSGAGIKILGELGIPFTGSPPLLTGYGVRGSIKYDLPISLAGFIKSGLLSPAGKIEAIRLGITLATIQAESTQHLTLRQWLDTRIRDTDLRQLAEALIRVSTYANDAEHIAAGAAISQTQLALRGNVLYLDGGWQTLVEKLVQRAQSVGVKILTSARVTSVEPQDTGFSVHLAGAAALTGGAVILAAGPAEVRDLVAGGRQTVLAGWADTAIPVLAACLDVGLSALPQPEALFALIVDRPLYYSVHSAAARLAPAGGALIHLARYIGAAEQLDAQAVEQELEGLLDLLQPGWRQVLITRRFLPRMTVYHALPTVASTGTSGLPGPAVPEIPGLYVAGDWVGPVGLLSDTSLASGRQVAQMILAAGLKAPPGASAYA